MGATRMGTGTGRGTGTPTGTPTGTGTGTGAGTGTGTGTGIGARQIEPVASNRRRGQRQHVTGPGPVTMSATSLLSTYKFSSANAASLERTMPFTCMIPAWG
ncbi:hypothetical protein E2F43_15325 [Seongchinamella unica]|uniref:Uncharacterized protein n=1 Tax=Seongchinamella unica TaxID=2547392 RepID=A0A4V2ZX42_9GAMM|nr:hypothetical protein E2F43_15325 [Seongchinamella unica]